jgi:cytochrome b6-f complex iron-sulfur subunit
MDDEKNPQTIESQEEEHTQAGPTCQLPSSGKGHMSRRDFLGLGLSVLGAIALVEVGGASALFLQSRSKEGKFGSIITAGAVDSFQPGSVTEFTDGRFFLVRSTEGGFLAVHTRCPHLGCTVMWVPENNSFLCPCHASHFDAYGNFEGPPVPRPLDMFAVVIEEGLVKVDTTHLHQRQNFTSDQLVFA